MFENQSHLRNKEMEFIENVIDFRDKISHFSLRSTPTFLKKLSDVMKVIVCLGNKGITSQDASHIGLSMKNVFSHIPMNTSKIGGKLNTIYYEFKNPSELFNFIEFIYLRSTNKGFGQLLADLDWVCVVHQKKVRRNDKPLEYTRFHSDLRISRIILILAKMYFRQINIYKRLKPQFSNLAEYDKARWELVQKYMDDILSLGLISQSNGNGYALTERGLALVEFVFDFINSGIDLDNSEVYDNSKVDYKNMDEMLKGILSTFQSEQ